MKHHIGLVGVLFVLIVGLFSVLDLPSNTQFAVSNVNSDQTNTLDTYSLAPEQERLVQLQSVGDAPLTTRKVFDSSGPLPNIYLTYDDGSSKITPVLLDVLDEYPDVKVTFFVNCREEVRGTFQRILEAGHGIANHTCSHPKLTSLSSSQIRKQLSALDSYVNSRVSPNIEIKAFRPPFGATNSFVNTIALKEGYQEWLWSVDPRDWESPGVDAILSKMISMKDGDIIVLHDSNGKTQTVEATKKFLAKYHDKRIFRTLKGAGTYPLVWEGTFKDDDNSQFENDIEWIAAQGITRGCNPPANDKYCPNEPVTREQMAAFLQRALKLDKKSTNSFKDDNDSQFEASIEAIAASGITRGCNPPINDKFCPEKVTTRGQMAAFLVRAFDLPNADQDLFTDDNDSQFEADINKLGAAGITRGCNPPTSDKFCPDESVSRAQMASFLRRAVEKFGD